MMLGGFEMGLPLQDLTTTPELAFTYSLESGYGSTELAVFSLSLPHEPLISIN